MLYCLCFCIQLNIQYIFFSLVDNQSKDRETDKHKETEIVLLEIYAVSKSDGEKLRSTLSAEIKDTFLQRDNCKNDKIKSLSTDTWKKMTSAANKHYVWLDRGNRLFI